MCPNVCDPTSPKFAASGASPIPTESITTTWILLNGLFIIIASNLMTLFYQKKAKNKGQTSDRKKFSEIFKHGDEIAYILPIILFY